MTLEEFLRKVASEPTRAEELDVWLTPPSLIAKASASKGMLLTEYLVKAKETGTHERRTVSFGHLLGPPASESALVGYQTRWPNLPLPADLRALVTRVNGIHLWADLLDGRSYAGLAPIEEWDFASKVMGPNPRLSERHIAISYDSDHGSYVVLDAGRGMYWLMDSAGPGETCPIGSSVEELLDWLWENRIAPGKNQGL